MALICVTSDSETFVAASRDGSLTLFKNGEAVKTVKLPGGARLVRYINGEIISAAENGKLTILNRELETLKTLKTHIGPTGSIRTLTANNKYIVSGNINGVVRYYNRNGDGLPANVSVFFKYNVLKNRIRFTIMETKSIRLTLIMTHSSVVRRIRQFKFGA